MWRIITNCTRFIRQNKLAVANGNLTQQLTVPTNDVAESDENKQQKASSSSTLPKPPLNLNNSESKNVVDSYKNCKKLILPRYKTMNKFKQKATNVNLGKQMTHCDHQYNHDECSNIDYKCDHQIEIMKSSINEIIVINKNEKLDDLFVKLNKLNEQTTGQIENIISLKKLSECKYEEAIPYLRIASEKGFCKASFNLGMCFQEGLGVEKDEKLAFYYFKLAAESGHVEASYNCAMYYLKYKQDNDMAIKYLRICVDNFDKDDGYHNVDVNYVRKIFAIFLISKQINYNEAFKSLNSIKSPDAECEYYLGLCYENEYGVAKNVTKALECYEKSFKNGNTDAKLRFIELKSKQTRNIRTNSIIGDEILTLKTQHSAKFKLGHFTHSIGQFEISAMLNKCKYNNNDCDKTSILTNKTNRLRPSYSSSQLSLLLSNDEYHQSINRSSSSSSHNSCNNNPTSPVVYVY